MESYENPRAGVLLDLLSAAEADPDAPFLTFEGEGETLTYRTFNEDLRRVAAGLAQLGVAPGDRVAGFLDNGPAAVLGWFATMALGAIWTPINTALRGDFLAHVLLDCAASAVIVEPDLAPLVSAAIKHTPNLRWVVLTGEAEKVAFPENISFKMFADLRHTAPLGELAQAVPADVACLIYTAGTTGPSKGCMLPHNYMLNLGRAAVLGRLRGEPLYTALPLFHLNALTSVVVTMLLGCRAVIGERFSVSGFWPSIERSGAKFVNLLGPMATMLARAPDNPAMQTCYGHLRRVISAPFTEEDRRIFAERFGLKEAHSVGGYGLTEAAPLTATPSHLESPPGASGMRSAWFDVQLVDDDDNILPAGEVGEIVCRPNFPHLMFAGYWGRPAETVDAFRNLWFHTGDLGRFDGDGFLYFIDRKKDYIRRRGENISSMEVEAVFAQHPAVAGVAAYGVSSELGEDDVQISVELREGANVTPEELCVWSVERLPYFAVPRFIEICDRLPTSAVGRLRKAELRARTRAYPRWDRESADIDVQRRRKA